MSRLLGSLWLTLAASPAFANCEVGAYFIHTLAEYKPCELDRVVLPYWGESASRLGFAGNGVDRDYAELLGSTLALSHGETSCARPVLSQVDRYDTPHKIERRLDAPHCAELIEDLPSHGYAYLNTAQQTLRFADALPIGIEALDPTDHAALEAEIAARLPELTLYAETGPGGQALRGRIEAEDIVGSRIETTTVGSAARPFVMAIAVLTLRNLDRLYGGLEGMPDDLATRLRGKTVEYPVIFFRTPSGPTRYVGDGSSCASYSVHSATDRPVAPPQLGAVERFRITGAFDTNGDGAPDLLEVNDRFAYLLEPDGGLFVVRVGLGC